jgi:hypothetical protein
MLNRGCEHQARECDVCRRHRMDAAREEILREMAREDGIVTVVEPMPTLRDQFAAAALTGLLAQEPTEYDSWEDYAEGAYEMADAMMRESEKELRGGAR